MDTKFLRLTQIDDEIYRHFREQFPDMKVDIVSEDEIKSPSQKEVKIYKFCFREK